MQLSYQGNHPVHRRRGVRTHRWLAIAPYATAITVFAFLFFIIALLPG